MAHSALRATCILAILVLAGLSAIAHAALPEGSPAPPPFLGGFLRETRIVYPLQVGGWRAVDEHLYENQALGVSVRYASDATPSRLDVYFYPMGKHDEDQFRAVFAEERLGIAAAREQSGDPAPDLGPIHDVEAPSPVATGDALAGHAVDAGLVVRGVEWDSAMVVLNHGLYFVKGRLSKPASPDGRVQARSELVAFMQALVPQLTIVNVGDCGRPLRIEALADGRHVEDARVTVTEGDSVAYVLADRVLATDPGSEQALLAQAVGGAVQGRNPPDCAGVEPINPDVGDTEREIRIEYRAQPVGAVPGSSAVVSGAGGQP